MRYLCVITIAIALIAAAFHFSKQLPDLGRSEEFLPKANYVRYISAGHEVTTAGIFWVRGLIDLGDSYLTGKEFTYLGSVGDLVTSLDSLFYTPYYFVGGITPTNSKDTTDIPVLRRAVRVYPDDWKLALYLALRLSGGPDKDNAGAAVVMKHFKDSPDTTIPPHIKLIYKSFELGAMQTEMALQTILNDCLQPEYKNFEGGLVAKTLRVLNRSAWDFKDAENKEIHEIIHGVIKREMSPQAAYDRLLQLKKKDS